MKITLNVSITIEASKETLEGAAPERDMKLFIENGAANGAFDLFEVQSVDAEMDWETLS